MVHISPTATTEIHDKGICGTDRRETDWVGTWEERGPEGGGMDWQFEINQM